jgi:hypothetical protein
MSTVGTFKDIAKLVETDEIISTDKYLAFCTNNDGLEYLKRDFLFTSGFFRGDWQYGVLKYRKTYKGKVVVLGHSDIATQKSTVRILKTLGLKFVLGVNTFPLPGISESLPLGITNYCDDTPVHRIIGNVEHFQDADSTSTFQSKFSPELYVNFSVTTNNHARGRVLSELGKLDKRFRINFETPEFTAKKRIEYLRNLRSNVMTVCPEGNGVDTHRLWETLYMGGVPIIISDPLIVNLVSDLPVIVLNNWSELQNINLLEAQWESIQGRAWDFRKIHASYWGESIMSAYIN